MSIEIIIEILTWEVLLTERTGGDIVNMCNKPMVVVGG